ncbi:Hypothetical protein SRAE_2000036200 [Strongyloides ratti]|uniref:C2 domain-containing protein n=1 Tax=Strongyloides ratti TaxID=34506 RepID=A0A090LDZ5_STRRB|nr:Hypothetical protein SRAE_2000036200 [Strongyloides ratti]CEF65685.1 Hypothetical protein SRAE_2000036200 [Strongyloides ratti]
MFIYLILCIIFNFSTSIPISRNKSCLKTTRCSEPRFQLSLLSNNNQDAIRIDASIDKNMQILSKIKLSNLFFGQSISTLTLSSTIIGKDPIFKIPVECDFSSQTDILEQSILYGTNFLEISGKCYSAIIEIKRTNSEDYYYNKKFNNQDKQMYSVTSNKTLTNILNVVFILILIITFMIISSYITILLMRERSENTVCGRVRRNQEVNAFNDIKVPPYAIRQFKKNKSNYGCRGKKTLSTIYESDDETPKRIPIVSQKDSSNCHRFSILEKLRKNDNDKVNEWMDQGYVRSSCIIEPTSLHSSEKDSGMPGSSINKNATPSDCGTSLFGGASGREDEIYIDVKNIIV